MWKYTVYYLDAFYMLRLAECSFLLLTDRDHSSQMVWNRAYKSSLPGNNRAHINRALLPNRILIIFWKFPWKAVSRNGSLCKQPQITINITCIVQLKSSMLFYIERQQCVLYLLILLFYFCTIFCQQLNVGLFWDFKHLILLNSRSSVSVTSLICNNRACDILVPLMYFS